MIKSLPWYALGNNSAYISLYPSDLVPYRYKPDSSSGSTKFFNLYYDFEPIKVLVGFRNWLVHQKYEFFRFEQSLDYNEISIGVGYEF